MEQKVGKQMGRPRSYNRDEVIGRALRLFWTRGADPPIDDLSRATGLHKPSLYAAFGGKRGLYLEALDSYLSESGRRMTEALATEPLLGALERFFEVDLDIFCGSDGQRGCFLISTAIDLSATDAQVRKRVNRAFSGMRANILARVEQAIAAGDVTHAVAAELVTDLITSTHVSLSVETRAGRSRQEMEEKVRRVLDLIATFR
jgi:TetR/AcrR family transcriptional repressor of nem operon